MSLFERQIGRIKNKAARNAVELDEGQRRGELIPGRDQYGAPTESLKPSTETRAPNQIAQSDARIGSPKSAAG